MALSTQEQSQRRELVREIQAKGYDQVVEEVAYTWFNRYIALRYMEVNNYLPSHIRVFSNAQGAFDPEILKEALHIDLPGLDQSKVAEYIEKTDKYRGDFYRYHTGHEWADARNYDLCLNSAKLGFQKCVDEIKSYMKIRFE